MTEFEGTTLRRVLEYHAGIRPSASALLSPGHPSLSYLQLLAAADHTRHWLATFGLGARSRIAVLLPTGIPLALANVVLACNATVIPLHPGLTPLELEALLREARADAVLGRPGDAVVSDLARQLGVPALPFDLSRLLQKSAEAPPNRQDHDASPAPGDTAFVLFTSGTSGKPKRVPLTQQQVLASARNIAQHLALTPDDRGLLVMPTFHGHGLIGGLLTPLVAGSSVVCTPGFDAVNFTQWITGFAPTWYSAAPSIHQAIADLGARLGPAWPEHRLRFARSASSALTPALMRDLEALWRVPVIEAYAMTEAATQMASNPLPPGIRKPGSVGPSAGAQVRVIDAQGHDQPCNVEGRVVVRGPALFSGYEDAPEQNKEAFLDGWFITGDLGWLGTDGYLCIAGRTSELINRGGEKIAPYEVEQALMALPGVAQAVAFAAPHPTLGEDVHAAVVLARNEVADPRALRRALFGALADFKIPATIHVLDKLPTGTAGKLQRRRMHEQIQSIPRASTGAPEVRQPLTALQARVAAHFEQILGQSIGDGDEDFLAMGGDSLSAARLALALSQGFGVQLPVAQVLASPSVTEIAALVQEAMDKAALHDDGAHAAHDDAAPPDLQDADGTAPLLLAQEGIWFVDQLGSGNAAYHIHSVTRLKGQLDAGRLQRSLHALLARHANLRTGFHTTDTEPGQRVIPAAQAMERFSLHLVEMPEGADETPRIAALIAEPFDLSHAPLLRAALLRVSGDEHVLVLVAHHIVVDGWSMTVLHRDLGQLYASGDAPALPALPLAPCEHARLQRQHFERGDMQAALDYWRVKLRDVQTLELPVDTPRTSRAAGSAGKTHDFRIEAALATALRRLARQHQVTLFTAVLTAFQALLLRYTGQTDIAIGVPVAGRDDPRLLDAVGQFVNTVVVRTDLQGQPGFIELMRRNRTTVVEALTHQQMPFERLVAELSPQRDAGRNPLYQVSFSLENFAHRDLALDGLQSERLGVHSACAKFDLSLTVIETGPGGHLDAEIEYRTDIFAPRSIERMAAHFGNLLSAMVVEPQSAVTRLPLMDAAERQRMLVAWNDPPQPLAHDHQSVHALFRAQARLTPDAVALRFGQQDMRYAQLDTLSDQLAHDLRRRGVVPGCVVGLCMPRCFGLVVGLLAVFKAGGTYLPLDSEHPPDRLQAMLVDAAPRFVLADAQHGGALRQLDAAANFGIIDVPADGGAMPADAVPAVRDLTRPEHVAYLIFTSGSTGMPKAAQLMHGGLANHVRWMKDTLGLTPRDRVLHKTSISFDASIWEFLSPLACGAQVVLAPPEVHRDMHRLAATLQANAVSVVQFVPSEMRVILGEAQMAQCTSLRYVLCGGEALDRDLALALRRCLPAVRLGNFYGPTEATVDSAWFEVGEQVPERAVVPIGRPVDNAQLYVLDAHMQPQPVNVAGELYVGGLGVGRGYLNRPELTAQRFLPNPFRPGERLYRTGDLARWLDEGVVEFIGRDDQQVKLRGFRIELGEVEAAVNACCGVTMCAVLAREDVPGQRELIAYVVVDSATGADAPALRTQLRARLPEHMVPAAFVFLPQLPRLANGKVDRRQLPRPESESVASDRTGPRSPVEESLHDIWQHVLGKSGFGIRTNFFDLGGHSLLATQIVSRVRSLFKVDLPLRSMFEHPTIEGQARLVNGKLGGPSFAESTALAPIALLSRAQSSPVSFSQRRLWLLHEMDPRGAAYNMCEALRLRGPLQHAALRTALNQMVMRHEAFRTTFELGDAEPMAVIGEPQAAVLIELDGSGWSGEDAEFERQAAHIAAEPFDLARAPLHRFILVRLGEQDHLLVMVMHHIIGDGWAWNVLLRELQALYGAAVQGKTANLPARAIDFIDFAAWQRAHIDDDVLALQTRYWMQQLAGWSPLNLPADTAVVQRISSQGARARLELSGAWIERVQRFSAQHSVSPFMSLLAAFQLLLSRYCGQDDVAVGTPIAGRTRVEAEEVVGSLINTLVLRCRLHPEQDFHALLAQVRETCLSAFAHQDIPLDYLVGRLRTQETGARVPDLRVMFSVLNVRRESVQMEGLDVSFLSLTLGATQVDLALSVDIEGERALFLTYSTELFSAETAQALLDNYAQLLDRLIESPGTPLQGIALPTPRQLALLASWNQTAVDHPRGQTLPGLLSLQSGNSAVALQQLPGATLHYTELWSSVHRLAHALRTRGVQRRTRVGLCLERDPTMVIAQLAVLAAGAAYVPLDPAYPKQRLNDMALDAGLVLLLTRQEQASLWEDLSLPTMLLDAPVDPTEHPDTAPTPDAARDAGPDDPAYVIYTSGSTGKPKGVVVPHRAAVNFLLSMQREPGLCAGDVLLAVTTLSFDISVLELLLPLSVGATVVLATREQAGDGLALSALLERSQANVMQATPSTWRLLIDSGWMGGPRIKALIGGESLSTHMAQALSGRAGEVWNLYGPTETTVWSTCWKVPGAAKSMSIGRPIANTRVHVLDAHGNCCPVGVSGEIFIGGEGVALGYLNRPELTAGRFVPEPFGSPPGAPMYRTGDRGRWRHDGTLEHQGRLDFQVKLRGHRIEPGEIEVQLQAHPAVLQCLVMAREDRPGDPRLVAYVVTADGTCDASALREHLRATLPDYMLPQHFVALQALPLLPNGKINRGALPPPGREPRTVRGPRQKGHSPAEGALARIWADVLDVEIEDIDSHDNFFDLGGDSLKAGRTVVLFERQWGFRMEPRRFIFETLSQLASGMELGSPAEQAVQATPSAEGGAGWWKRLVKNLQ
ncbi:amino acid adenylation domain-containing protein [Variovorax sp. J22R133]|uniref:non-ribosomal peptide synthetase n=1 Tax=Variovorax brevis TaxID=3053503 RepID=UPI002578D502|nr:non-ribosomal peptide synthetase [Variovorax sp. J22R133]MDM0111295.1 amino acid adenylation domain-containing protein [Variovorax sp. J22R133]